MQTGGVERGETSTRSNPRSLALFAASCVEIIPTFSPFSSIKITLGLLISLFVLYLGILILFIILKLKIKTYGGGDGNCAHV